MQIKLWLRRNDFHIISECNKLREKEYKTRQEWVRKVKFAVPADYNVKIKENETRDRCLDLARELKKLWNIKVMVIPTGALGAISKDLVKRLEEWEIGEQAETIKTEALSRILRRVLETFCNSDSNQKPPANLMLKTRQE